MIKKILLISVLFGAIFFFTTESYGLVMGPARFEVSLPPGEVAEGDYYVQNETDENVHITVEPVNMYTGSADPGKLSVKDWMEFDIYEFDLKPKEIKKLRLRIQVPKDVQGELAAQIFFTSDVLSQDNKPSGGIKARIGAVLYVAIKGTEIIEAEIKNIYISKESTEGKNRLKIEIDVKNNGNAHIRPEGKIIIEDEGGKKIAELELLSGSTALPGEAKIYNALWENPELKEGSYKISVIVKYGKDLNIEKEATLVKTFNINKDGKVTEE